LAKQFKVNTRLFVLLVTSFFTIQVLGILLAKSLSQKNEITYAIELLFLNVNQNRNVYLSLCHEFCA